jgi:putative addiction module component (TIGR02574 family)
VEQWKRQEFCAEGNLQQNARYFSDANLATLNYITSAGSVEVLMREEVESYDSGDRYDGGTMSTYEEIISAALALPPGSRAMLAEHLLDSLNGEDQKRIDALWADEIERRIREVDEGKVIPIPGDEVMERLRSRRSRR